ncbi:MAG: cell division protein ZapA [Sediminibacterium sp.]|jgi:cell division protein ZapA
MSSQEEMIPVNITIADRTYRVKVAPKDEEAVRKTAAIINQKMIEFKGAYAGKDMQDYISMVLLWFATEQQQSGQNLYELESVQNQIETLKNSIEKAISGT